MVALASVTAATILGNTEVQSDPSTALALSPRPMFTIFLSMQPLSAGHTACVVLLPTRHHYAGTDPPPTLALHPGPTTQLRSFSCVCTSQLTDPGQSPL